MPEPKHTRISSGAPWEAIVGYSRAVVAGNVLKISGTTAVNAEGNVVGEGDPYRQMLYILEKIGKVLAEAGFGWEHVVRTRMYVTDISQWEAIGRAHGEVFRDIRPASTMVEVRALISPELLVEVEVTAMK